MFSGPNWRHATNMLWQFCQFRSRVSKRIVYGHCLCGLKRISQLTGHIKYMDIDSHKKHYGLLEDFAP